MVNKIIDGILETLSEVFGDNVTLYTEPKEQGLKEPCFFVLAINPSMELFLNRRYHRENPFDIVYFPKSTDMPNQECQQVSEKLFESLEYITVNGDLVRGTRMSARIEDEILHFFINYNFFVNSTEKKTLMEELTQKDIVVGG